MPVINESGLYSLIMGSQLPAAKEFKHWVTSEVLPSIRKTGGYHAGPTPTEALAAVKALHKVWGTPEESIILSLLRQGGFDIPDDPRSGMLSGESELDAVVADFLDWLLPQIQHWSLVPFPELYALFIVYQKQNSLKLDCSRNKLIDICERVMPRQGWELPGRASGGKHRSLRVGHKMDGEEPVMRLIAVRDVPVAVRGICRMQ